MAATDSLYTKIYNHLLDRVSSISAKEVDFSKSGGRASLVSSSRTFTPGSIEIGPGTAIFEESAQRRAGRPREIVEWGWVVRFGFERVVDVSSIADALSADTLVAADATLGTGAFRAVLVSVTPQEPPRRSEEHGTFFEVEFNLELQRK